MKKITLLFLFFVTSAFAGKWEVIDKEVKKANTVDQIEILLNLYPEELYLLQGESGNLKFLNITLSTYKYIGVHTCSQDDQRLIQNTFNYSACFKSPQGVDSACIIPSVDIFFPSDPCLSTAQ